MAEHILVELDFIPVEERLPFTEFETFMVIFGDLMREAQWKDGKWQNFVGGTFIDFHVQPSHWAKIPQIEGA